MGSLWRWVSLRHLLGEGGRALLVIGGVALGVGVFLAIRLATRSAMASFRDTVDTVAGTANLQVTADGSGLDERLYPRVRRLPGVRAAAPVVQAYVRADFSPVREHGAFDKRAGGAGFRETLLLLGVDPFREVPFRRFSVPEERIGAGEGAGLLTDPRGTVVPHSLAARRRLRAGSRISIVVNGRVHRLTVRGVLPSQELDQAMGGSVLIVDIAAAQEILERFGRLDRIDLLVDDGETGAVRRELAAILPAHAGVGRPGSRTRQVENMVAAFGLNLSALSFIALFVSMFLIFNAVSMAVLRRREEIGALRCLGVTRRGVLALFLAEAAVVGLLGSAAGLALGTAMAQAALGSVARTITTLYLVVHVERLSPDPAAYAGSFVLGIGMSLLSALAPALEAAAIPPGIVVRQGMHLDARRVPVRALAAWGAAALLLAVAVALWTVGERRPQGGFVSAFLLLIGTALAAPAVVRAGAALLERTRPPGAGVEHRLGVRSVADSVSRTSVAVAALMVAVAMLIGLAVMVGSFRKTVAIWVEQTLRGDLYVEPVGRDVSGSAARLPDRVVEMAQALPGVAAVDTYRAVETTVGDRITRVVGIDFGVQADHGSLQFLSGDGASILRRAIREGEAIASESFAFHHRVGTGDAVGLKTPSGPVLLRIAGVFYDYSSDAGFLMVDRSLYRRLWQEDRIESVALYLRPGEDADRARREFERSAGEEALLFVTPSRSLRRRVLQIFDQTFQITYALQAVAAWVAVLAVISTLSTLVVLRGREIGVLRAVGATRGQVRRMVLSESILIGALGAVLGCAAGLGLALLLVYVINKQFFGWTIRLHLEPWLLVQVSLVMVAASVLSGLIPARLAAGRLPAEAMRTE